MAELLHTIGQYWTRRASSYTDVIKKTLADGWDQVWADELISHFPDGGDRPLRVLDIGTGPGFYAIILACRGYEVTAVDYSEGMLREARRNAGQLADRIRFARMDAQRLDFASGSFDVPATRLQFYILNEATMDDAVRAAVNLTVDCDAIALYLGGTVSPAVGPFSTTAAYGKVTKPTPDLEKARTLLEEDGYTLNGSGLYEKDGQPLTLTVAYYAARSLDSIALLMQEQLKAVGITVAFNCQEDPDATYIANRDFDIALYCMIADKNGDPYYFIDSTLRDGGYFDVGGFDNEACEEMIRQLQYETDGAARADLSNRIVQIAIDDNAFGYVGLFHKTTVMRRGVENISENSPFDFYLINAATNITA